jgi:hypothetical protein
LLGILLRLTTDRSQTKFHTSGNLLDNGTEALYNAGGVISTPVSGNTFTGTFHNVPQQVTAAAANKAVPTKTEPEAKGSTASA